MSQENPVIGSGQSGTAYRTADNNGKTALLNHHKGGSAPSYKEAGIIWLDDAATPWLLKIYDGTDWIAIAAINTVTNAIVPYHGAVGISIATLGAAAIGAAQTFSGAQKVSATALTSSSAHIATDLSLNNIYTHTLTENTTLDNPTNIVAGWQGSFQFTNHASSPKTLAYGSFFKFPGGTVPVLTATNGATDTLFCSARSATFIEANLVKGFA